MGKRYSAKGPLRNEAAVRELLALMDEYNAPGRKELAAMVSQIGVLERQLDDAAKQIAAMRQELAEVRQGPVKRALLAAVHGLEKGVSALGARLDELKAAVVDGCRRALAAVRERGISALAHTARFFRLGPSVERLGQQIDRCTALADRGLEGVASISRDYHETGRRLRNAGRVLLGREPDAEAKAPGRLAGAVALPLEKEKAVLAAMRLGAERFSERLALLEQAARPPIRQTMEQANRKLAQERQERPAPALEHDGR